MPQWEWAGFDVLENWAEGKHPRIVQAVYDAMFQAVDDPHPGQEVPFSKTGNLRVIHTPRAVIYFQTSGQAWNSAHDTLHLTSIVDI